MKAAAFCFYCRRIFTPNCTAHSNTYDGYFRNRFYDPSIGRFISQDPLGMVDGPNMYNFCGGDPVNRSDPMGTDWEWIQPQGANYGFWRWIEGTPYYPKPTGPGKKDGEIFVSPEKPPHSDAAIARQRVLAKNMFGFILYGEGEAYAQLVRMQYENNQWAGRMRLSDPPPHPYEIVPMAISGTVEGGAEGALMLADIPTGGGVGLAITIHQVLRDVDSGKITVTEAEQILRERAEGQVLATALAMLLARASGNGFTGRQPTGKAANAPETIKIPGGGGKGSPVDDMVVKELEAQNKLVDLQGKTYKGHMLTRHSPLVSEEALKLRATRGILPDFYDAGLTSDQMLANMSRAGIKAYSTNASKFFSYADMQAAIEKAMNAYSVSGKSGRDAITIEMGRVVGGGYMKGASDVFRTTTKVRVFFDESGKVVTAFPDL
ncbi:MAG: hypothetical protein L6R28_11850 [Planctomycetes bacterium]|nr:hypothetical protein [Planctomycetota bacterium]